MGGNNMNIGIDIDGVITNEKKGKENVWLKSLNNYFQKEITRKKDVYNFTEAYDISFEDLKGFLEDKLQEIYSNVDISPNAKKIIDKIKNKGHTVYLVTARHKEFRPLTIQWLKKHNINYDYLYHDHNKAELALEKNIELFIEDNKSNAEQLLAENIPVILIKKYHNKGIEDNDILYRVKNWDDIEDILKNMLPNFK